MKLGEVGVSQYTQLVCMRVFVAWGNVQKRLCHNLQDQYSCGDLGEMQADTILRQGTCLNFRISCMAAPMECWMVAGGSVLHGVGEVQVHRRSTTIFRGQ